MKRIVGDPLTGALPRTRLIVPQAIMGPARKPARPLMWPCVPDPAAVTMVQMHPGRIAYVRTRFGVKRRQIRVVHFSLQGRNHGRHYFVGHDRRGRCHTAWVDQVIRVESVRLALGTGTR